MAVFAERCASTILHGDGSRACRLASIVGLITHVIAGLIAAAVSHLILVPAISHLILIAAAVPHLVLIAAAIAHLVLVPAAIAHLVTALTALAVVIHSCAIPAGTAVHPVRSTPGTAIHPVPAAATTGPLMILIGRAGRLMSIAWGLMLSRRLMLRRRLMLSRRWRPALFIVRPQKRRKRYRQQRAKYHQPVSAASFPTHGYLLFACTNYCTPGTWAVLVNF